MTNQSASPSAGPMGHLAKVNQVQVARVSRSYRAAAEAALVFTRSAADGSGPALAQEFMELQEAASKRAVGLVDAWSKRWGAWWNYAADPKGANTASKLAERHTNAAAQLTQLIGNQLTELVEFQENVEVSYAFWISQKLRSPNQIPSR